MVHLNFLEVLDRDITHEPDEEIGLNITRTEHTSPTSTIKIYDPTQAVLTILQTSHPGKIRPNTILLEYKEELDCVKIINQVLYMNNNMLLLKNGHKLPVQGRTIDIWWRGERNGNLMVLLAYIMKTSGSGNSGKYNNIRFIRKIGKDEDKIKAYEEMNELFSKARLYGEVRIVPYSDEPFMQTLWNTSATTDLIMMGLPGNYTVTESEKYFELSEVFFADQIKQYDKFPAIMFVKSAEAINLIEE
jgi:hypothetical protein